MLPALPGCGRIMVTTYRAYALGSTAQRPSSGSRLAGGGLPAVQGSDDGSITTKADRFAPHLASSPALRASYNGNDWCIPL